MNKSEKLLSAFSQLYFFEEFVQDNLQFSENNGNAQELADLILNLEDVVIAIQMKERSDADRTTDENKEKKWFDNKMHEAKKQIKRTIDFIRCGKNTVFHNKRDIEIKIRADAEIVPLLIFNNESIEDYQRLFKKHSENGLTVNCISLQDFKLMCSTLVSPGEIIDYLKYRSLFYENNVARSLEYKAIVSYFIFRYDHIDSIGDMVLRESFREFVKQTAERSIVGRDTADTFSIILFLAHFDRVKIKAFIDEVSLAKEKAKIGEYGIVGSLRDDNGEKFVIFFKASEFGNPDPVDKLVKCAEKKCKFNQLLQVVVWWENREKFRIDYFSLKIYLEDIKNDQ